MKQIEHHEKDNRSPSKDVLDTKMSKDAKQGKRSKGTMDIVTKLKFFSHNILSQPCFLLDCVCFSKIK